MKAVGESHWADTLEREGAAGVVRKKGEKQGAETGQQDGSSIEPDSMLRLLPDREKFAVKATGKERSC